MSTNAQSIISHLNAAREAFDAGKPYTGYSHLDHIEALVQGAEQGEIVARYNFSEPAAQNAVYRTAAATDGTRYVAEADGETFVVVAYPA